MITKYNVGSREPVIFGVGIMTREGETKSLYCHMIAIVFAKKLVHGVGYSEGRIGVDSLYVNSTRTRRRRCGRRTERWLVGLSLGWDG